MLRHRLRCLAIILLSVVIPFSSGVTKELSVYVGTYTGGESQGIYLLKFNTDSGQLKLVGLAAESENPSFLAVHPSGKTLYAVNETNSFQGEETGAVSAFAIDPTTHRLKLLNQRPSGGTAPCHLVIDATGHSLLLANYGSGSVAAIRLEDDGSLGMRSAFIQHEGSSVNERRQQSPHGHSINLDSGNRFAVAADLGIDRLLVYAFDATKGALSAHSSVALKPGAGPRHFDFHPNGKYAFAINELHSTITALEYDSKAGTLRDLQTISTLPEDFNGRNSTAEVRVSPNGKFVFGSNRGHDSIAVFRVDEANGRLKYVQNAPIGGRTPRNFVLDPAGSFLLAAGQSTHNIVVFRIDPESGRLTPAGYEARVPSPVCIRFAIH